MFSKQDIKDICALTPMQRGMLHHTLLEPDSHAYREQLILRLDGKIDTARLEEAWQTVVNRHDALRGRFLSERVSNPVQVIPHREAVTLALHRIAEPAQTVGDDGLPAELEAFLACEQARGFDLANAHPMRLALFSADSDRHWLVWSFHHILIDGWSIGLVLDEVLAIYGGQGSAPVAGSYPQYLRWLVARDSKAALTYWQTALDGFSGDALLPAASPPHAEAHAASAIDSATARRLRTLAQAQRASLHHLLLCAWGLTVGRQLDQCDVLVPTVLAGRPTDVADADQLVGLLINTVPMRVTWQDDDSFTALLQKVRDHSLDAAQHQYVSMADIQSATGKLPIDHVLLVQGMPGQDVLGSRCGDAAIGWAGFRESIPYALEVSLTPHDNGIGISLRGRQDAVWLQHMADSLCQLLIAIAESPQQRLGDLDLIGTTQRAALLSWGDGGSTPAETHGTVLQAFDAQLANAPDAPALVCNGITLSYRQLDRRANRLAHALLAHGPLAPDTPVALVSHRDANLLAGLLAILRAGAAYVPVDPDFPADRVRLMLEASGCRHVLVPADLAATLPPLSGTNILHLDATWTNAADTPPDCAVVPDHLAYIIFTSGSTGTPKGTMLRHRNATAFFACLPDVFGFQPGDRILGVTTVSFDIAGLELLGALTCGMTVVLASAAQARDPAALRELIERERVNVLQMTPTRLQLLLDEGNRLPGIRTLLVGGEALPQTLADKLLALHHLRVFNVYGPTETTIWSACWPLTQGPVSLGRALPGEQLLLVSRQHHLQAPGAIGEIAIAGAGVARGYLNDPARTAERFIDLPGIDGPVYLTGDLGRWTNNGQLEYLGRRDDQIKVRGMRIEIGEIEHHLRQLPGVQDAAVTAKKNASGELDLIAYLAGLPTDADIAALRATLALHLPAAMIPARFVFLPALPQTPNGKTDRRALPEPEPLAQEHATRVPANQLEATLTRIFSDVLGHAIGPDDDFFVKGGHSLKAIQTVGRLNRELGANYNLRDLYRASSAAALSRLNVGRGMPITRAPDAADYPLSHAQQALWVLQQMQPDYAGYNVPGTYLVKGKLNIDALSRAWEALMARHEALRTVFRLVNGQPRQVVLEKIAFSIDNRTSTTLPTSSSCKGEGWDGGSTVGATTSPNRPHSTPTLTLPLQEGGNPSATLEATIKQLTCQPFDLANGPLFRIALLPLDADCHILLLVTHHIISDGWSDALLVADLASAYRAALSGADPRTALPAAPTIRYRDFAAWQQRYLASPLAHNHRDYWTERLRDLPQLELPTDHPRSSTLSRRGARIDMRMDDAEAVAWLQAIPPGRRYATLAAATLTVLHLESGQTDLVLGLPIANRDRAELQDQVGLHLNMLPLRRQLRTDAPLEQLREDCAGAIVEAMEHADYPFARLVDELGCTAAPGRHPVFDAMLIYHQHAVPVLELEGVEVTVHESQSYTSRFDLDFEVWTTDKGVYGFIEYDADLFTAERAEGIASRWKTVLTAQREKLLMSLQELRQTLVPKSDESASFLAKSLVLDDEF